MLADARPSVHLARTLCTGSFAVTPIVLAETPPSAILALVPHPRVLANPRLSTLLAQAPSPIVLADASPSAILALA